MTSIIQQIKTATNLAELIAETYTLTGPENRRIRSTQEHDSLIIWQDTQTWHWFSQGVGGDCLDWLQHTTGCDLNTAIDHLAQRAGIERRPPTPEEQAARIEEEKHHAILRIAADHYHRNLLTLPPTAPARTHCKSRAWNAQTINNEQIGFSGDAFSGDNKPLSPENNPSLSKRLQQANLHHHPTAKAVLSIPSNMLVYTHQNRGRILGLSARSIHGKRHYQLPGLDKVPYYNHLAQSPLSQRGRGAGGEGLLILVEGPADAIALAHLGHPAVALCGLTTADHDLGAWGITHLGLDSDKPGHQRSLEIAAAINPILPIIDWGNNEWGNNALDHAPKDPAEYLQAGATPEQLTATLALAEPAILHMARAASTATGDDRTAQQRHLLDAYASLDPLIATDIKPRLANRLGIGISQLNRLLKARERETGNGKDSPERYEYSAGGNRGGHIWEQCVTFNKDGSAVATYAVRTPDGKIKTQPMLDIANTTYTPYSPDTGVINAQVVHFPERPEPYGDQRQLLRRIQEFIHRYLDIDPFYERLAAYYVLFSWVYDLFENLPYLRALGDYGTGKTRYLQAIGILCYRPMFVSGASSVSPIFRLIDMYRGTLIIDEADFANSDADAEIIKILNVGYYSSGVVLRSEKDPASHAEAWSPQVYRVYGPKILATRLPFSDRATESRCLTRRMTTARPRPGIPYTLPPEFWTDATALRNQLLQYRLENWQPVTIDPALADESVEPRLNQVTMALKTLVDDDMRSDIDQFIRAYNETLISDRQMSLPALVVQALTDIHHTPKTDLMGNDLRDFTMKGIADKTREIAIELDPDIKVHPRIISKILSEELGLPRRRTCPRTRRAALEYDNRDLTALMQRYGIDPPPQTPDPKDSEGSKDKTGV